MIRKNISVSFAKRLKKIIDNENDNNVKVDLHLSRDFNNTQYLFLEFSSSNVNVPKDVVYKSMIKFLRENEIKYGIPKKNKKERCLIFIPLNQEISYLVESGESKKPALFPIKKYKKA